MVAVGAVLIGQRLPAAAQRLEVANHKRPAWVTNSSSESGRWWRAHGLALEAGQLHRLGHADAPGGQGGQHRRQLRPPGGPDGSGPGPRPATSCRWPGPRRSPWHAHRPGTPRPRRPGRAATPCRLDPAALQVQGQQPLGHHPAIHRRWKIRLHHRHTNKCTPGAIHSGTVGRWHLEAARRRPGILQATRGSVRHSNGGRRWVLIVGPF